MYNQISDNSNLRFDGFYRGIVIDNNDPKKAGRIKIRVYPMFESVSENALPWAIPADPSFGGSANVGGINVPIEGSHVFLFFENGDHRYPVYFASAPAIENDSPDVPTLSREDDGTVAAIDAARSTSVSTASGGTWDEPESAYSPVYPNNRVYRSEKGILIEIDDTTDNVRFHVYHPSGTRREIDNAGNETEHVVAKKTTVIVGNNNIEVKGSQDTTVGTNHGIKIGNDGKVSVGNDYTIDAGNNCNITAGANCVLTITGNVTLSASGTVTISGTTVNIN